MSRGSERLPAALQPAWVDEARGVAQQHLFRATLGAATLRGRCLDAGHGQGLHVPFLESLPHLEGIVAIDVELPPAGPDSNGAPHARVRGSLTALPFADGAFDCCLCSEVLEHIPDDEAAVAELARVLKPGASLLLSVPTPPAPHDPAHVREGYSLDELSALLGRHGLVVRRHTFGFRASMRLLYVVWRMLYRLTSRSWLPRFVVRGCGLADRFVRVGRPWDLVVLASNRRSVASGRA